MFVKRIYQMTYGGFFIFLLISCVFVWSEKRILLNMLWLAAEFECGYYKSLVMVQCDNVSHQGATRHAVLKEGILHFLSILYSYDVEVNVKHGLISSKTCHKHKKKSSACSEGFIYSVACTINKQPSV